MYYKKKKELTGLMYVIFAIKKKVKKYKKKY